MLFFSLKAFNIFSLISMLVVLMIICHGVVLFLLSLFGVKSVKFLSSLEASRLDLGKTFSRLGNFLLLFY
jgi:hypothetical protein